MIKSCKNCKWFGSENNKVWSESPCWGCKRIADDNWEAKE